MTSERRQRVGTLEPGHWTLKSVRASDSLPVRWHYASLERLLEDAADEMLAGVATASGVIGPDGMIAMNSDDVADRLEKLIKDRRKRGARGFP